MPTPTYDLIEEQVLSSAQASVTFSSIPGTYKDLVLEIVGTNSGSTDDIQLRFNSDTGSNYSRTFLEGTGSAANSNRNSNVTGAFLGGYVTGSANFCSYIQFMSYANTNVNKTQIARGNIPSAYVYATVGLWRNTAAITTVLVGWQASGQYGSGTTFRLWGVAG